MNKFNGFLAAAIGSGLLITACGSAKGGAAEEKSSTARASVKQPATAIGTVGINVAGIQGGSRPFMNLIYGSSWMMHGRFGPSSAVSHDSIDVNGWVKSVPAGYHVTRALSVPLNAGKFICRYQGKGTLAISGPAVSNVATSARTTQFSLAATYPNPKPATLSYTVDPSDYIRNIDCREANASTTDTIAPDFLAALGIFKTIRFMKWQVATEGNWPVTWATRNKPGDGDFTTKDGVPIEVMVEAANRAHANLWVTVPWNADDDYVTRFASYVHDNLAPSHRVFVEVSNEVWNGGYAVAGQATREAKAEELPSATGSGTAGNLERYAEKTRQVMAIWTTAFADQKSRLVRVASWQHVSPYFSELLLKYMNLSQSIDALATAPYFGYEATSAMSLDQIMAALPNDVTGAVNAGTQQKAVAQKFGLKYITYEGGQSVVLRDNLALEQQVERDPRMKHVYDHFLGAWQTQVGDGITLFALDGQISPFGAWGVSEYVGQPISQAPKQQALNDFLGLAKHAK